MDFTKVIAEYGFPIVATMGMAYFIFFIWKWVTNEIDVVIGQAMGTLIKLVDRVRMLDNDLIRLNSKLSMVLEYRAKLNPQRQDELQRLVDEYKTQSNDFDSGGNKETKEPLKKRTAR
jgi:hypothetical protein